MVHGKVEDMAKKEQKSHSGKASLKFPRISRFIPEKGQFSRTLYLIVYACVSLSVLLVGYQLFISLSQYARLSSKKKEIESKLTFWQQTAVNYPGYRDAYFQIAILDFQLGYKDEAKNSLNKALELDPNFQKGRELEKILASN